MDFTFSQEKRYDRVCGGSQEFKEELWQEELREFRRSKLSIGGEIKIWKY